jgi:hypothetical protein
MLSVYSELGSKELFAAILILNALFTSLYISIIASFEALSCELTNFSALMTIASISISYLSFSLVFFACKIWIESFKLLACSNN